MEAISNGNSQCTFRLPSETTYKLSPRWPIKAPHVWTACSFKTAFISSERRHWKNSLEEEMASVVAPGALLLFQRPSPSPNPTLRFAPPLNPSNHRLSLSSSPPHPKPLHLSACRFSSPAVKISASASSTANPLAASSSSASPLSDSTRTVSSIIAIAFSLSKLLLDSIRRFSTSVSRVCVSPTPDERAAIQSLRHNVVCAVGPLFFAAVSYGSRGGGRTSGYVSTPISVIAAGMAKWLQLYDGVLIVRVLLSWFPNVPWDRQPLSAIRDLCDPYLNLFRNIIPPVFDTLDVSPIPAFMFLGFLSMLLDITANPPAH
ncbi:hypothetical protein ACLOJK_012905 [Asimina triloba]